MKRNTRPSSVSFGLLTIALTPSSQLRERFTCGRRVLFCCRAENFKECLVHNSRSSLGLVSPHAISPVPEKRRKVSSRGSKAAAAAVITSSPYKNDLKNKNMKRQEKESKLVKTKNKKNTAKRNKQTKKNKDDSEEEDSEELDVIQFDEDSEHDELMDQVPPDSADAECMFCSRLFSMDKSGESWIKCLMCGLWAHYDCAGPEFDTWICDFCK